MFQYMILTGTELDSSPNLKLNCYNVPQEFLCNSDEESPTFLPKKAKREDGESCRLMLKKVSSMQQLSNSCTP